MNWNKTTSNLQSVLIFVEKAQMVLISSIICYTDYTSPETKF